MAKQRPKITPEQKSELDPMESLMATLSELAPQAFGAAVRRSRLSQQLSQADVARELQITPQAVSQWERGETVPDFDNLRKLARTLNLALTPAELEYQRRPLIRSFDPAQPEQEERRVWIVGYVGAGSQAHFFPSGDLDDVPAPPWATSNTVAVEVRGESLGSLFDRWLVFYDDVRRPITSDLIGKLCVVGLTDERVLIKKVRRGKDGLFDLLSDEKREEPITDVAIEWAAKVLHMTPR